MKLTLEQLQAAAPEALKPLVAQYGPDVVKLGESEFQAAWAALLAGDVDAVLRDTLPQKTLDELVVEGAEFTAQDQADTNANAARVAKQREIAKAGLTAVFTLAMTLI